MTEGRMQGMTTGQKIALARRACGMTQEELAGRLGVSRQSVSKWESDIALPETDKLVRLCDELHLGCDELLRPGGLSSAPEIARQGAPAEAPAREDARQGKEQPAAGGRAPLSVGAVVFLTLLFSVGGLLLVAAAAMFFALSGGGIGAYIGSVAVLFWLGIGLIVLAVIVKLFLQKR